MLNGFSPEFEFLNIRLYSAASLVLGLALAGSVSADDARSLDAGGDAAPRVFVDSFRSESEAVKLGYPDVSTRVLSGELAYPSDNPFQVGLVLASDRNNVTSLFCGATLYKPDIVITSAFCVDLAQGRKIEVLVGTRRLDKGGERRKVVDVRVHPKFNIANLDYDVALLRLSSPVVGIPVASLAATNAPVGTQLLVTGWGPTTPDGTNSVMLRKSLLPVIDQGLCNSSKLYDGFITPRTFCAGVIGKKIGPCLSDLGGPISRGRELVGISGVIGSCGGVDDLPPTFTRIANAEIRNFILNND